ncbi:MAG: hypothetical protein LQ351_003040 [Letrouitia transgressa]|nr:MAG: hypothetical protein LQ351_003040 [Letrouitia transgressa]
MANSTLPFTSATSEDPEFPSLPKAYGFNILLLSNTSSASLDCPVPDYLRELQGQMTVNEAYTLTADVRGIVTTYNESIEVYRNDDAFWNYYLNMTGDNEDEYISAKNQSDRDKLLVLRLDSKDMFNSHSLNLLMNDLLVLNTSWTFASFLNSSYRGGPAEVEASAFRSSAMLFQTRRESCRGTWRITYNSIRLVDGSCDGPRLPDQSQQMLTQAVLALRIWYMPMLCEYLGAFSDLRNASVWKVPTFTTVIASMYWSRLSKRRTQTKSNLEKWDEYDFYIVQDHLVSERRVMNTSPWLLVVLAFFPVLTTFAFAGCIILHKVPIDGQRFGIVALLAGVKHDTLKLLDGASLSGDLKRRVGVRFERKTGQQIEYSLTDGQATPSGQWKIFGGSRYSPVKSEY